MIKKILLLLLFATNIVYGALDIGAITKNVVATTATGGGGNAGSPAKAVNLDKIFDDIKKSTQNELQKKIDELNANFNKEVQKFSDRLDKEILGKAKKLVDKADKEFDNLVSIKNNIGYYIALVKTIVITIALIVLFFVFVLVISYVRARRILKIDFNCIPQILKKVEELEKKVDLLLKK